MNSTILINDGTGGIQSDSIQALDSSGDSRVNVVRATKGVRNAGHTYQHLVAITGSQTLDETTWNGTVYAVTPSGADATITLDAAANWTDKCITVKKHELIGATTAWAVIINPNSTELIDQALNLALYVNQQSATFYSDGVRWHLVGGRPCLVFAAVAASSALTGTGSATPWDNIGIAGTLNIRANTLKAGDTLHISSQGIATAHNASDTLTNLLKLGSTTLATTGAVNYTANDIWWFDCYIQFRTIGASGTYIAYGTQGFGTMATATAKPFFLASTVADTTGALAITQTGTMSSSSGSNSARLDGFMAEFVV